MIKSIKDRLPQLEKLRENGIVRGEDTGFRCLDEFYSVKQGTYTIIYSEPTHGKSEFSFEICFNQAEKFAKRSLICSPETGTIDEIIAEMIHKYAGKQIYKTEYTHLTDLEFNTAVEWLNYHFVVIDTDEKTYSIPDLFELANQWEIDNPGESIDIIMGEPYNELNHDKMALFGSRQDLYIEDLIGELRRSCRKKNKMGRLRHFILTIHPSGSTSPITKDGSTYYPKPLPRQAAGGQALYRKAMTWITLWRPPANYKNEYGQPCKDNEVHVHIDKAKPKGVSKRGMCKLFLNWKRNRYYEESWGQLFYAFEQPKTSYISENSENNVSVIENLISVPGSDEQEELPF